MDIFDTVHTISAYLPINENNFVKDWKNPTKKAGIHESI